MIVVILVIFVPVVIAIFFFSSALVSTDDERLTVNLASPSVSQRMISGEPYWDAVLNINKVTPRDEDVPWLSISVVIKSNNGGLLLSNTPVSLDIEGGYDGTSDGIVFVEVWFVAINPKRLSAGDAIKITGMTQNFEGGLVQILQKGRIIGDTQLPTDFP